MPSADLGSVLKLALRLPRGRIPPATLSHWLPKSYSQTFGLMWCCRNQVNAVGYIMALLCYYPIVLEIHRMVISQQYSGDPSSMGCQWHYFNHGQMFRKCWIKQRQLVSSSENFWGTLMMACLVNLQGAYQQVAFLRPFGNYIFVVLVFKDNIFKKCWFREGAKKSRAWHDWKHTFVSLDRAAGSRIYLSPITLYALYQFDKRRVSSKVWFPTCGKEVFGTVLFWRPPDFQIRGGESNDWAETWKRRGQCIETRWFGFFLEYDIKM